MVLSSELNKRITFEIKSEEKVEGFEQESWSFLKKKWAKKEVVGTDPGFDENYAFPEKTTLWTIRYDPSINYDCRIDYKGKKFSIEFIDEIGNEEEMRIESTQYGKE